MFDDLIVLGLAGALGFAAIVTIVLVFVRRSALIFELRRVDVLEGLSSDVRGQSGLAAAIREHIVREDTPDGHKFVLSKSLGDVRREYAEDAVAHSGSFSFGGMLTAFALICTFILIAWVMTTDVSDAIRANESSSSASSGLLSSAVAKLGGKFWISATGIGGSVLALLATNRARADIYRAAEHPPAELLAHFSSIEEEMLKAKWHELELMRADREQRVADNAISAGYLESINAKAQKLTSIEVSVQTIGNEVSANLKNIMKDAMAEQIREIMTEVMVRVESMATKLEEELTEGFRTSLQLMGSELKKALEGVQKAVDNQGQGQLEKILEQLQNTMSGGFQSESKKMVAAFESFTKVVPALEQQLRQMSGEVARDTQQRNEQTSAITQQLMSRVSQLMDSLGSQAAANASAIERLQAVSEQGADAMARRLESTGTEMVSNLLTSSRAEIEAIASSLRASAEASAKRSSDLEERAAQAATLVAHAAQGLSNSAQSLNELANQTTTALSQARQGGEAIQFASQQFVTAGNTLLGSVAAIQKVIDEVRARTVEHQNLLERQRSYTKEVEALWPTLFDTYLAKFKASSEELGRIWEQTHSKIQSATSSIGSEFADNTAALSEAVEKLVRIQGGRGA